MDETTRLALPLVQAAQAQKHVTVNEALTRLDALVQLTLRSRLISTPPLAQEGDVYAVAAGAVNEWAGQEGELAVFSGGGWDFLSPGVGWRAFVADEGTEAIFDGMDWVTGTGAVSPGGASFVHRVVEIDHVIGAGAVSVSVNVIPANTLVFGVTGRVSSAVTGTLTSWQLGIDGVSPNRYGSGLGLAQGSFARGLTSSPLAYYVDTPLTLTAEGGAFSGGTVRLAVHLGELTPPRA